jgi:glycosyltransferase involved in cell wall biosynthesis
MKQKTITVFTPTYNRAHLLPVAYNSLKCQTVMDFEWLIVDDGSTDNTRAVVDAFIAEGAMDIRYVWQENRGQYFAHNTALDHACGELLSFLDSDDSYTPQAMERIIYYYNQIKDNDTFAGVCGLKADRSGRIIGGGGLPLLDCTVIDYRYRYKQKGDKAECFKLKYARECPFPVFEGKYSPNALVWNRIGHVRKLRYFAEVCMICEWCDDSMSRTVTANRRSTPDAYLLHYSELSNYRIPFWQKLRAGINYWRFAPCSHRNFVDKWRGITQWKSIIGLPAGLLFYLCDTLEERRRK